MFEYVLRKLGLVPMSEIQRAYVYRSAGMQKEFEKHLKRLRSVYGVEV